MPAIASFLAGFVGAFSENAANYSFSHEVAAAIGLAPEYSGLLMVFGGVGVGLLLFATVLWLISGMLVRWMHGAERTQPATVAAGIDQELSAVAEHEGLGEQAKK